MRKIVQYQRASGSPWMAVPSGITASAAWRMYHSGQWYAMQFEDGEVVVRPQAGASR